MSMMKKKARSAINDYTKPYEKDEGEGFNMTKNPADNAAEEDGSDEPADVDGLAKKEKKKEKADSSWAKKVVGAIAGLAGAAAGATQQHRDNVRKEKAYQAKRKTGNYL